MITAGKATMAQLGEFGLEDLWDTLEVISVDAHNARVMRKRAEQATGKK